MSTLVSIGIPVRNEEANLPQLISRLTKVVLELESRDYEVEIIVNNNFSTDNSGAILQDWAAVDSRVVLNILPAPLSFQESIQQLMQKAKGD